MFRKYIYVIALSLFVTVPLMVSRCSGDGDTEKTEKAEQAEKKAPPEYNGWTEYTYRTFVYHFRRDASWRDEMHKIAKAFENALKLDCEFFGKPCPEGPIHVYIYNSPKEAETLLGKDVPYVTENQIHWERVGTPYGVGIMMYLLDFWEMEKPQYDFIREGVVTLRDFSQRDYHDLTGRFISEGSYIPLNEMLDNTAYNKHERQVRSWQAASLVAFITGTQGVDKFLEFWGSSQSFEQFIRENAGVGLDEFEQIWMQYALQEYNNSQNQNNQ